VRITSENRHVWLMMDNCSAHSLPVGATACTWGDNEFKGFTMSAVKVLFLPHNTTSEVQPLDQGVIRAFKAHFRRNHVRWIIQQLDENPNKSADFFKPNMKQALLWCRDALPHVSGSTPRNSFRKAGILGPALEAQMQSLDSMKERTLATTLIGAAIEDITAALRRIGFDELEMTPEDLMDNPLERTETRQCDLVVEYTAASDGEDELKIAEKELKEGLKDSLEEEGGEEIPVISLREAKRVSQQLHMFVMENMVQLGEEWEERANKLSQVVCRMVTSVGEKQSDIRSFF